MIRRLAAIIIACHVLAAGHLIFRTPLNMPLLQRHGHRSLSQNQPRFKGHQHFMRLKLKFMRSQRMFLHDLNRFNQMAISLRSKAVIVARRASNILSLAVKILKKVLLLLSWYKFLSLILEVYASTTQKIQEITEISSSIRFVANFIIDNGKMVTANAKDFLKLMSLVMFLASLLSGSYIFALALIFAQYHRHSIMTKLDTVIGKADE